MWNVHRMFITYIHIIEHRNPETRKTRNDFLVQVRNFLLPLSLKVLRHKERYAHSFYSGFSICPPPKKKHVHTRRKASASKRKSTVFLRAELNRLFSNLPKSSAHASGAWHHSHLLVLGFLFWNLWTTHPPRVRVNTCAQVCTKLTYALSRKVLSRTKPKGKIYKTKFLGHYITLCPTNLSCKYLFKGTYSWDNGYCDKQQTLLSCEFDLQCSINFALCQTKLSLVNVSVNMSSGPLQVIVNLWNLHGTSNYVLYWIHEGCLFWFR